MAVARGQQPDPNHAKARTYEGTKTTAKLKAERKILTSGHYDKAAKEIDVPE